MKQYRVTIGTKQHLLCLDSLSLFRNLLNETERGQAERQANRVSLLFIHVTLYLKRETHKK